MQARSRRTVDALLDATAQVLIAEGWSKTSTNRVAARAGTSIGTLYEYFPSKEALVTALTERLWDELAQKTMETMDVALANPTEHTVRFWLGTMVEVLEREAPLVRVLATEVPFFWQIPRVSEMQRRLEAMATARFEAISRITGREYTPETVFVMTSITRATILQIATDRPAELDRERLIDELADVINARFTR